MTTALARVLLLTVAIVLAAIAGALFFGWVSDTTSTADALGLLAFSLAAFEAAHL